MIPEGYRANFRTLLRAADDGRLALLECRDAKRPDLPRYVIVAVGDDPDSPGGVQLTPFGHLYDGDGGEFDPFGAYLPPDPDGGPGDFIQPEDL